MLTDSRRRMWNVNNSVDKHVCKRNANNNIAAMSWCLAVACHIWQQFCLLDALGYADYMDSMHISISLVCVCMCMCAPISVVHSFALIDRCTSAGLLRCGLIFSNSAYIYAENEIHFWAPCRPLTYFGRVIIFLSFHHATHNVFHSTAHNYGFLINYLLLSLENASMQHSF